MTVSKNNMRNDALRMAVNQIEKQFGEGSIMKLGQRKTMKVESIPTGSISLDLALGVGGVPKGRIVEIYGPESSGKTTLTMHIVAQCQKKGGMAAFVDAEHAFDPEYAKNIGINIDELLISQPDTGEQALEITETLVRSNALDVIVVDSVAALTPKHEIDGDMGDANVGLQARLMSQALRKLTAIVNKTKTCVIFINQIRMKIGVMFGNPETTTGGMALKFYSSVRMDIRRIGALKEGDEIVGSRTRVKIVKNKVAPPFKQAEFDILPPYGISYEGDLLDTGVKYDVVSKSGSWYTLGEEKLGQGKSSARNFLKKSPDITKKIEKEIYVKIKEKDNQ
jgi:recombination protein RecA